MSSRRVAVLLMAGVLIVGLAIWFASSRHAERDTLAGDLVLPGLEGALNSVTEARLSKGDGTLTTLKKGSVDWTVGERDYPADSGKVRKLLLDLAALNVVEEKTRTAENYPQLGVEDTNSPKATGTRVDVVTAAKTYGLIVGKSSSAKSGYVRTAGSPQSFLAAPLITLDADPHSWLDHTLIDIPQDRVKDVAVKLADGPGYTLSRANKEQMDFNVAEVPKGRQLSSPAAADPIAGALAALSLDDVRHPPAPQANSAAPAPAHATFHTFDGLQIDVAGRKEGTRTFVSFTLQSTAKESQTEAQALGARLKDWEYEIAGYKYDALFRPLEDLLQKPPEPAKKPAPSAGASKKK
jgi:hypothetical protein